MRPAGRRITRVFAEWISDVCIAHEIVPACLDAGIGRLSWSPLGGWLAGKYKRNTLQAIATTRGTSIGCPSPPRSADIPQVIGVSPNYK